MLHPSRPLYSMDTSFRPLGFSFPSIEYVDNIFSTSNDPPILKYEDCLIRKSDLLVLEQDRWINDTIIEFAYEFIESQYLKSDPVLLLKPSIAYLISHIPDTSSLDSALPENISEKILIFMPVNDSTNYREGGGSHWSLLAYYKPLNCFFHYDSLNHYNGHVAQSFASKLADVLKFPDYRFYDMPTPKQSNGSDCGIFVIAISRLLCQRYLRWRNSVSDEFIDFYIDEEIRPDGPIQERNGLRDLILSLSCSPSNRM